MSADKETHIDRVRIVATMLCRGLYKTHIVTKCSEMWGLKRSTIYGYLHRARSMMRAETRKSFEEHLDSAIRFYQSIKTDPRSSPIVQSKAQERIDKLLGLESPTIVHSQVDVTLDDARRKVSELMADPRSADLVLELAERDEVLQRSIGNN